jgi:ribonuclease BN (tRNA processing enzyme)
MQNGKKDGTLIRPSKRVEEWETVDDIETAKERVKYWAEFFTEKGFGKRFGFWHEASPTGHKVLLIDRSIPEDDNPKSKGKKK